MSAAAMIIRVRSRDGLERVTVREPSSATVTALKSQIHSQLGVPVAAQTLSLNHNLLLSKSSSDAAAFSDLSDPSALLAPLGISHGSVVFLSYFDLARTVRGPAAFAPVAGRVMTVADLISRQVHLNRQEKPQCASVSFDGDAANAFQLYVNQTLAFAVKRGGFLYGRVEEEGVFVEFIYEPPQHGGEEALQLARDPEEEALVEAIAAGLGLRRVGFVFTQAAGHTGRGKYTMTARELLQAAEVHAEGGIDKWVTALVKLEEDEDGVADVHFEAFQLSDVCVKLFKDGCFVTEIQKDDDPKKSRVKKEAVVCGKDCKEVDND